MTRNVSLLLIGITVVLVGVLLRVQHIPRLSEIFMLGGMVLEVIALVLLFNEQRKKAS